MCGRYTLTTPAGALARAFGLDPLPQQWRPRYNIAPAQDVAVLTNTAPRTLQMYRWGLIPAWARDPSSGNRLINARAESVAEKPSFRSALRQRRCLVLADGFYEWQQRKDGKIPIYFRLRSHAPFALAGLWETWSAGDAGELRSCTIITTSANATVAPVHNRMPVILAPEHHTVWLTTGDRSTTAPALLLRPCPPEWIEAYQVSRRVNSPSHDDPDCIRPA